MLKQKLWTSRVTERRFKTVCRLWLVRNVQSKSAKFALLQLILQWFLVGEKCVLKFFGGLEGNLRYFENSFGHWIPYPESLDRPLSQIFITNPREFNFQIPGKKLRNNLSGEFCPVNKHNLNLPRSFWMNFRNKSHWSAGICDWVCDSSAYIRIALIDPYYFYRYQSITQPPQSQKPNTPNSLFRSLKVPRWNSLSLFFNELQFPLFGYAAKELCAILRLALDIQCSF